jgi:hypothetical protein
MRPVAASTAGPRRRRGRSLARGGCPPRRSGLGCVGRPGSSAVKVATPAAAVRLGLELALKLHQAPDLIAVGTDVRLDLGGQLSGDGQVDAEQLHALCQVPTRAGYGTRVRGVKRGDNLQ